MARATALLLVLTVAPRLRAQQLTFSDEARERGLTIVNHCGDPTKKRYLLEEIGNGCALFDMDGDGDLDLFLADGCSLETPKSADDLKRDLAPRRDGQCRLYQNDGRGRFADVTETSGAGLRAFAQGVVAADYDGDGDVDLYVTCFGANRLLQNDGHGKFVDVTEKAGVGDSNWSVGAAFFDADGDGDLDLYVSDYVAMAVARDPNCWRKLDCPYFEIPAACGPKGMVPELDCFYVNQGDGTFSDASVSSGIRAVDARFGLGAVAFDHDDDGDVDVYVGNDSRANYLFDNDGHGHFKEIADLAGCGTNRNGTEQASMGVACGDFDGNGFLDLAVTTFSHDDKTVYRNDGGGFFMDVTSRLGFGARAYFALGWGSDFVDLDLDGDLDLFMANGHVYPEADRRAPELSYRQQNLVWRNDDAKRFVDVTDASGSGLQRKASFRGAAFGDVDDDGDVDVVVVAMNEAPTLLVNHAADRDSGGATATNGANNASGGVTGRSHWLLLALEGAGKNRGAIGARVVAESGGRKQHRQVRSGGSFASSSDPRVHFGLGAATKIDALTVTWPDGTTQKFADVAADRIVRLKQGGELEEQRRP